MLYYGTKLSDNISMRPEGYLLCLNVPVARTGYQDYLPEELGLPLGSGPPNELVKVYRPEEEVFSPECLASFEGMPVTNDHPAEGVDITNVKALGKGHAQNIRRGVGEESDLLIADLMIQDPRLIDLIMKEGKREISCGYTYQLEEVDGRLEQHCIRGNHIAVVDAGRAGHRVAIKDSEPDTHNANKEGVLMMKKSLYKKLVKMARDGDPEALAALEELTEEIFTEEPETPDVNVTVVNTEGAQPAAAPVAPVAPAAPAAAPVAEAPAAEPAVAAETVEVNNDENGEVLGQILAALNRVIELLTPASGDSNCGAQTPDCGTASGDDDPIEEIVEAVAEAIGEAVEEPAAVQTVEAVTEALGGETQAEGTLEEIISSVLEPVNEEPEEEPVSRDALRAALGTIRPVLAKMSPKARKKAAGDIAARLKKAQSVGGKDSLLAALAARSKPDDKDSGELGRRIMAARNPMYKK